MAGGRLTGLEEALSSGSVDHIGFYSAVKDTHPPVAGVNVMKPRAKASRTPAPPLGMGVGNVPLP